MGAADYLPSPRSISKPEGQEGRVTRSSGSLITIAPVFRADTGVETIALDLGVRQDVRSLDERYSGANSR